MTQDTFTHTQGCYAESTVSWAEPRDFEEALTMLQVIQSGYMVQSNRARKWKEAYVTQIRNCFNCDDERQSFLDKLVAKISDLELTLKKTRVEFQGTVARYEEMQCYQKRIIDLLLMQSSTPNLCESTFKRQVTNTEILRWNSNNRVGIARSVSDVCDETPTTLKEIGFTLPKCKANKFRRSKQFFKTLLGAESPLNTLDESRLSTHISVSLEDAQSDISFSSPEVSRKTKMKNIELNRWIEKGKPKSNRTEKIKSKPVNFQPMERDQ